MADEDGSGLWPLPKFLFSVEIPGVPDNPAFQELIGLDIEPQAFDYHDRNATQFSTTKMPGLSKPGSVTLKRGVFVNDNAVWDWFGQIATNTAARQTIRIKLLNENGAATKVWTLTNAFPIKVAGTDMKAEGNDVGVASLEIAFEALEIANV